MPRYSSPAGTKKLERKNSDNSTLSEPPSTRWGWEYFFDGMDLTGDPTYVKSGDFVCALFFEVSLIAAQVFEGLTSNERILNTTWSTMWIFLIFLATCSAAVLLAAFVAPGNSRRLTYRCWWWHSLFWLIVLFIFGIHIFNYKLRIQNMNMSKWPTVGVSMLLMHVINCLVILCIHIRHYHSRGDHINVVLNHDERGRWASDDVSGFMRAAGVTDDRSFWAPGRENCSYPSLLETFKEYFCPSVFQERENTDDFQHLRNFTRHVQVVLPPRLKVGIYLVALIVLVLSVDLIRRSSRLRTRFEERVQLLDSLGYNANLQNAEMVQKKLEIDVGESHTNFSQELNKTGFELVIEALLWGIQNQENLTDLIANRSLAKPLLKQRLEKVALELRDELSATLEQVRERAEIAVSVKVRSALAKSDASRIKQSLDSVDAWLQRVFTIFLVAVPALGVFTFWFLYASVLAYRKGILELALSSPHYRFHPLVHNCLQDKKFVGVFVSSFFVGWGMLLLIVALVAAVLSMDLFWIGLLNNIKTVIALLTYYVVSLVLVPQIHARLVFGVDKLQHPRRQAVLIFVWELFFSVQTTISVLLHLVMVNIAAVFMLFRPDQAVLPRGWEWVDSFHFAYVSTQHEQLQSGIRRHDSNKHTGPGCHEGSSEKGMFNITAPQSNSATGAAATSSDARNDSRAASAREAVAHYAGAAHAAAFVEGVAVGTETGLLQRPVAAEHDATMYGTGLGRANLDDEVGEPPPMPMKMSL